MGAARAFELVGKFILTSFLASVSFPGMPFAEEAPPAATAPAAESSKPSAAVGTDLKSVPPSVPPTGNQKLKLNEVEIHGELQKPNIFFILPKAKRDAEAKQRQFRFYPDILEPLDKDRFEEEARVLYQHGIPAE